MTLRPDTALPEGDIEGRKAVINVPTGLPDGRTFYADTLVPSLRKVVMTWRYPSDLTLPCPREISR
ncbi:hypothetical protein, partial [Gluconobacter cerinus]|uniref:hypothetical protein n=1 Tax=Gluconobacter cerinus TaxID=38307 RepID=UPI001B8CD071